MLVRFVSLAILGQSAYAVTVPAAPPSNASPKLDAAPLGVSLEFFTFPDYMNSVPATATCLKNMGDLSGTMPPMRIGGTTQDRATFDASLTTAVKYTVADPKDAPTTLTYGPSFMQIAGKYTGSVVIGFNRRLNNLSNTIAAAKLAVQYITKLNSIELGNEPDLYTSSDPIAGGSWSVSKDVSSQVSWQASVAQGVGKTAIIEAGVYLQPPTWSTANLAPKEGNSLQYVKNFCGHSYPQSACGGASTNLQSLMTHSGIVSYTKKYATEAAAAKAVGKPYVLGETNSATCGGGGISPTFGAALWIVDYVLQGMINGAARMYFHQGTIGNCQYCWWGKYSMGAPYYGAYFVSAALANADSVAMLDDGKGAYATYAVYKANKPIRVVLYNSDYYTSGTRATRSFSLEGLNVGASIKAKRLTAQYATSRQDQGQIPTFGGQSFTDATCAISGTEKFETATVSSSGSVSFSVGASEALLVYLA